MDEWTPPGLSPAAMLDEIEHRRFLERCAEQLSEYDATIRRRPAPDAVTWAALDKRLNKICGNILAVCERFKQRIEALEAKSIGQYLGPWQKGGDYKPGNFVTSPGSLWHCKAVPGTRPGTCPDAWTLVAKRGRDGRDAR